MTGRYNHQKRADGTRVRYTRKKPYRSYRCSYALNYSHEPHPRPYCFDASKIDWVVWRHIVDYAIKQPELILEQVANRQAQLKSQGDKIGSEIAKLRQRLEEIKAERLNYSRQLAKGQITEDEFAILTTEADEARKELEKDMEQYIILRDDAQRVQEGISYAEKLLMTLEKILPEIDQLPDELDKLPEDEQIKIMLERQKIIRALCDQVAIYADGHIVIHGLLDGSEGLQFELIGS